MGTSKRRLNAKIKKLLKDLRLDEINESAPVISDLILTQTNLKREFDTEETVNNSIDIITKNFKMLSTDGFNGKTKEEVSEDTLTQQEFLEAILDEIEHEKVIKSKILNKSLRIVMVNFIKTEFDIYSFTQLLFHQIIYQLLSKELNDTLKDGFDQLEYDAIGQMVNSLTSKIMNQSMYNSINLFIDKKVSLEQVLNEITTQTSEAHFGEF